jgi:hypothetical protein
MIPNQKSLESLEYDVASLLAAHPPLFRHPLKRMVYDLVTQHGPSLEGRIRYGRWESAVLPELLVAPSCEVLCEPDYYTYHAPAAKVCAWHVNFADPNLFFAYDSALLAQDELQVLEHPILGSLREALLAAGKSVRTREGRVATPVTVMGAPRQCAFDTFPNAFEGRPEGLYGNRFQDASPAQVQSALTVLNPSTRTHLLAIAAPRGSGKYTLEQITDVLTTAHSGMLAVVAESRRAAGDGIVIEIHTGYWGCGAFGGNRVLMSLLQILAAHLAGIDRLVYYTGSQSEVFPFEEGRRLLDGVIQSSGTSGVSVANLLASIEAKNFSWGVSDGN